MANNFNSRQRAALKSVPRNKLLLETDAPYCPPVGKKLNAPSLLDYTAESVATILGDISPEEKSTNCDPWYQQPPHRSRDLATAAPSKPSSGRIISLSHNFHLNNNDDQETGSLPNQQKPFCDALCQEDPLSNRGGAMEVNNNMGGELPGVDQPDDEGRGYPDQFRDSLDERPASNSSADSRGMDDSPIDEPADSQDSLNAEKQYQDDLKERVRQSFKDLGMEPEGVLNRKNLEETNKSAKRKKKQPASERQTSHKSGSSGSRDDTRGGSVEDVASDHSNEPANYADEPAAYGDETNAYSKDPQGQSEPINGSNDPIASNYPDPESAYEDQATPTRYPDDRGQENDNLTGAYPNGDDDQISHPYGDIVNSEPTEEGDHANDNTAGQVGLSPIRQPEEVTGVENNGAPVNYPDQDQFEDTEYENNPAEDEGIRNNSKPGVDPTADSYPKEDNYPEGGNYPERDSYPNEDGYHEDARYPEESGYPEEGNYPQGGSYPKGDAHDNVPRENAYMPEDENNYPKGQTPSISSSYPRRYDNQDYADDEEQYDDRNQAPHEQQEPFDQTPNDSLDYGQPTRDSNNAVPPDSLDFEEPDNAAINRTALGFPNTQVSETYPQDSLDDGYPEQAREPTHPNDTHEKDDTDDNGAEDAPYDSLEEEESYNVPNTIPPQREDESANAHAPKQNSPQEERPGNKQPLSISPLHSDVALRSGHSSNNSSANSSREILGGLGSGKHSNSHGSPSAGGSAGLKDLPPQGRRKTPSRSGSRGLGSRGSNRPNYSDLARQRGSANQKGSAGSNSSNKRRSPQQNPQSQGNTVQGNQTRVRSLSNRIKATPIPADELSAKELLKRTRSKSDAAVEVPRVEHSDSQIVRKNGEEVRVAYISDDSGDEGEHFLDEKGSPVDHFGKPLYRDLHGTQTKPEEPKVEFRIKPTPPKEKSPLELQTINARRTSADDGRSPSGKKSHGGKITIAKPFPVEEPIVKNEVGNQNGLSNETLPPRHSTPKHISEPMIQKTAAQQEGVNESTRPPPFQDKTESPSSSASKSRTPFGEVRLRSVGTVMSGKSMGRGRTPPVSETKEGDPYRDLRFETDAAQKHGRDNKSAVQRAINNDLEVEEKKSITNHTPPKTRKPLSSTYKKEDFEKPEDYPSVSRGASGASYQDRGIQYTPQAGQNRERQTSSKSQGTQDPMFQQPYSAQQGHPVHHQDEFNNQHQHLYPNPQSQSTMNQQPGFPGAAPQHSQGNSDGFRMQQGWEQQAPGVPWSNAHPSQVPQQFYGAQPAPQYNPQQGSHNPPEEYFYNQQYSGYNVPMERSDVPYQDQAQYYDQQHPYDTGYQNNPGPATQQARPPGPQDYINHSQNPSRVYPNQGMQPAPGQYPNPGLPAQNEQPRQRGPPKTKPNFIDLNKTNLARGPPRRKYSEMQKKVPTPTRINPKKPLPDISRESSQYDDPLVEDAHYPGSAQTWAHEDWTHQLIQDQRNLPLRRGHSDTNLYIQNQGPGPIPQGYYPQGVPAMSGYNESGPGYTQAPQAFQPGYNQTYPQVLRSMNGQPYSYSADHATQIARNNGFARPQMSGPPRARVAFADDYHDSFDSDMNPMVYANEGTGAGYQHATRRTSPYHVLPDIPGHSKPGEDGTSPLRKSDPDSYTARLLKQKQPPQYKEYTIKDYRNLKSDIRLGGLGPDPDLITEKQEKVNRQRDYAKTVMQQNKKQLQQTKRLWPQESVTPKDASPSKRDIALAYSQRVPKPQVRSDSPTDGDDWPKDSRTLAMEYSKKIPKPRMPTPPEVLHERMYGALSRQHGASSRQLGASSRQQAQEEEEHEERAASEMARLEELRARHMKEKEEVERLKMEALS
ncbi:LOW QUALITY PROTEIN: uncharacterized protein LOC119732808 [Patiria miniata]|uniref:Uncharacterized protein n=1 Tax=Patiria miniata TaxID=46514 RepID=A0A914AEH5_PATMI|nr:LOW QUALITY PROTEIN: uncharacterized protein LOC119732808 [Patiria miniata]